MPSGEPSHFVKRKVAAPAGFFEAEAAGLRWLAAAVPDGGVAVVGVLDVGPGTITVARLSQVRPTRAQAEDFGRALALTHASGATAFGVGPDGGPGAAWIGRQRLVLGDFAHWGEFYADLRLLPYARAARAVDQLSAVGLAAVERVCDRLRSGEFDDDRPVGRIHGDLWTGNVVWTERGGTVIDPAAHGGHGQTDLAMLALFGAPHLAVIQSAYVEAAELADGWADRMGLHQLHPLLVHAVSHGPTYGVEVEKVACRYV